MTVENVAGTRLASCLRLRCRLRRGRVRLTGLQPYEKLHSVKAEQLAHAVTPEHVQVFTYPQDSRV